MKALPKIITNTIFQGFGRTITATSSVLITIMVARLFGPSSLGDLNKILVFVALFYQVADFGFNAVVVKDIRVQKSRTENLIVNLFGLRLVFALILAVLALLIGVLLPFDPLTNTGFSPIVKIGIALGSLTILTQALLFSASAYFQATLRYDKLAISLFVGGLTTVAVAFGLVKLFFNSWPDALLAIVGAYVAGGIVAGLVAILLVASSLPVFKVRVDISSWFDIIKRTAPIGLTLIFNLIYFRVDILILSAVRPSVEVGYYSLAYKIFEFTLILPIYLINTAYPIMVDRYQQGLTHLRQFAVRILIFLMGIAVLVSATLFLLGPTLARLIGGEGFAESVPALQILSLSIPLFYSSALLMWLLITFEKQKLLLYIYGAGALVNIVLNLLLIPIFGFLAAAIITGFSELLIVTATGYFVWQKLRG